MRVGSETVVRPVVVLPARVIWPVRLGYSVPRRCVREPELVAPSTRPVLVVRRRPLPSEPVPVSISGVAAGSNMVSKTVSSFKTS